MKKVQQSNSTISMELKAEFQKDIQKFTAQLEAFITGQEKVLFGSVIKAEMPQGNTQDIVERFVVLGTAQLQREGVRRMRARSIAKHTFSDLLPEVMNDLGV